MGILKLVFIGNLLSTHWAGPSQSVGPIHHCSEQRGQYEATLRPRPRHPQREARSE